MSDAGTARVSRAHSAHGGLVNPTDGAVARAGETPAVPKARAT